MDLVTRIRKSRQLYRQVSQLLMLSGKFAAEKVIVVKHPFENYDDFDYDEIPVHGSIVVLTHPQIIEFKTPVEIELRIDESYPKTQPAIFFRTPIIHPDVDEKNEFSSTKLKQITNYSASTSLTTIVKSVVDHLDNPDVKTPTSAYFDSEYLLGTIELDRMVLDSVKKCPFYDVTC